MDVQRTALTDYCHMQSYLKKDCRRKVLNTIDVDGCTFIQVLLQNTIKGCVLHNCRYNSLGKYSLICDTHMILALLRMNFNAYCNCCYV